MVRLVREIQDLCEAVFHVEQPHHNAENAQHARFPAEPQSCKVGHGLPSPKAGDLSDRLRLRVNLLAGVPQACPFVCRWLLVAISHLRQSGDAPHVTAPKARRNPKEFFTLRYEIWEGRLQP